MAHVLIGFYRSLTEAETIVHDLVEQGFARPCITLATPHATVPAPEHLGLQTWSTLEGAEGLRRRFLDLGVPAGEVSTYIEAVRQGGTLVVVQASAEQGERGLDILHGQRPGDCQGGRPQWQYLGHVGVVSHGDSTRHTAPGTVDTPGLAHSEAAFRQHQRATAPESGRPIWSTSPSTAMAMTSASVSPSRPGGRWKSRSGRAGNGGIRAPGSASKTPSVMAGRLSVAPSKPADHREEGCGFPAAYTEGLSMGGPEEAPAL
jgi:hypothetical protein